MIVAVTVKVPIAWFYSSISLQDPRTNEPVNLVTNHSAVRLSTWSFATRSVSRAAADWVQHSPPRSPAALSNSCALSSLGGAACASAPHPALCQGDWMYRNRENESSLLMPRMRHIGRVRHQRQGGKVILTLSSCRRRTCNGCHPKKV